jgi:hypothetical protein
MPRYFLNIRDGFEIDDPEGMELPDFAAALDEATKSARELLAEGARVGLSHSHWTISVTDEAGKVVATVQFADVVEKDDPLPSPRS